MAERDGSFARLRSSGVGPGVVQLGGVLAIPGVLVARAGDAADVGHALAFAVRGVFAEDGAGGGIAGGAAVLGWDAGRVGQPGREVAALWLDIGVARMGEAA